MYCWLMFDLLLFSILLFSIFLQWRLQWFLERKTGRRPLNCPRNTTVGIVSCSESSKYGWNQWSNHSISNQNHIISYHIISIDIYIYNLYNYIVLYIYIDIYIYIHYICVCMKPSSQTHPKPFLRLRSWRWCKRSLRQGMKQSSKMVWRLKKNVETVTSSHQCFTNASPSSTLEISWNLQISLVVRGGVLPWSLSETSTCTSRASSSAPESVTSWKGWSFPNQNYGFVDLQMTFTTQKQRSEGQNRKVRAPELLLCHLHWLLQFLRFLRFLCPFSSFSFSSWPQHRHLPRPPRRGHHRSRLRPLGPPPPRPPRPQPLQPSRKGWHRMTGIMFEAQKNPWWMGWFMNYSTCQEIPEVYHTNDMVDINGVWDEQSLSNLIDGVIIGWHL